MTHLVTQLLPFSHDTSAAYIYIYIEIKKTHTSVIYEYVSLLKKYKER